MKRKEILVFSIAILAVVLAAVFVRVTDNVNAQSVKDRHNGVIIDHDAIIGGDVTISGGLDVDGTSNLDVVDIDGAVDMATTATVGSGLTLTAGPLVLGAQSETVTATFTITPTAPYVVISSDSAYTSNTTTPIATTGVVTGQVVIVRNGNASDALTIDGTGGTVECKANLVLGASDTTTFIFNGTAWNCLALYDNS